MNLLDFFFLSLSLKANGREISFLIFKSEIPLHLHIENDGYEILFQRKEKIARCWLHYVFAILGITISSQSILLLLARHCKTWNSTEYLWSILPRPYLRQRKFWPDTFDPKVTYCMNSILGFSDQYHLCNEKKGLDTFEGLNWLPSGSESW